MWRCHRRQRARHLGGDSGRRRIQRPLKIQDVHGLIGLDTQDEFEAVLFALRRKLLSLLWGLNAQDERFFAGAGPCHRIVLARL